MFPHIREFGNEGRNRKKAFHRVSEDARPPRCSHALSSPPSALRTRSIRSFISDSNHLNTSSPRRPTDVSLRRGAARRIDYDGQSSMISREQGWRDPPEVFFLLNSPHSRPPSPSDILKSDASFLGRASRVSMRELPRRVTGLREIPGRSRELDRAWEAGANPARTRRRERRRTSHKVTVRALRPDGKTRREDDPRVGRPTLLHGQTRSGRTHGILGRRVLPLPKNPNSRNSSGPLPKASSGPLPKASS